MHENINPIIGLVMFMAIIGYLLACMLADAFKTTPRSMNRAVFIGGWVVFLSCYYYGVQLYAAKSLIWLAVPAVLFISYALTANWILGYIEREINAGFQLSRQISEQASRLFEVLDTDGDGVISYSGLGNTYREAVEQGVDKDLLSHLIHSFEQIGHAVGNGILITMNDLTSYHQRFVDRYAAWFDNDGAS